MIPNHFELNQIVYGKVKGFDWWPGIIKEYPGKRKEWKDCYKVNYIGDKRHSYLMEDKIKPFDPSKVEFQTKKKLRINYALEAAIKIATGVQSYEEHMREFKKILPTREGKSMLLRQKRKKSSSNTESSRTNNQSGNMKEESFKYFIYPKPKFSAEDSNMEPETADSYAELSAKPIKLKIIQNEYSDNEYEAAMLMKDLHLLKKKPEPPLVIIENSNQSNPSLDSSGEPVFFQEYIEKPTLFTNNNSYKFYSQVNESRFKANESFFQNYQAENEHEAKVLSNSNRYSEQKIYNPTKSKIIVDGDESNDDQIKNHDNEKKRLNEDITDFNASVAPTILKSTQDANTIKNNATKKKNESSKAKVSLKSNNSKIRKQYALNEDISDKDCNERIAPESKSSSLNKSVQDNLKRHKKGSSIAIKGKQDYSSMDENEKIRGDSVEGSKLSGQDFQEHQEIAAADKGMNAHNYNSRSKSKSKQNLNQILNKELVEMSILSFENCEKKSVYAMEDKYAISKKLSEISLIVNSFITKLESLLKTADFTGHIKLLYSIMKEAQHQQIGRSENREVNCKLKLGEISSLLSLVEAVFNSAKLVEQEKDVYAKTYKKYEDLGKKQINRNGKNVKSKSKPKPPEIIKRENESLEESEENQHEDNEYSYSDDKVMSKGKNKKSESENKNNRDMKIDDSIVETCSNKIEEEIVPWTNFSYSSNIKNCFNILKDLGISDFDSPEEFCFKLRNDIHMLYLIEELMKSLPKINSSADSYFSEIMKAILVRFYFIFYRRMIFLKIPETCWESILT